MRWILTVEDRSREEAAVMRRKNIYPNSGLVCRSLI